MNPIKIEELIEQLEEDIDLKCPHRVKNPYERNSIYLCDRIDEESECDINSCRFYQLRVLLYENREVWEEDEK